MVLRLYLSNTGIVFLITKNATGTAFAKRRQNPVYCNLEKRPEDLYMQYVKSAVPHPSKRPELSDAETTSLEATLREMIDAWAYLLREQEDDHQKRHAWSTWFKKKVSPSPKKTRRRV